VADSHHALSSPHLARVAPVLAQVGKEVSDVRTWGSLWMVIGGAFVATCVAGRRANPVARAFGLTWLAQGRRCSWP
jgi:hypothetical protein